jgi:uncharacterized FlgJ-related protein
MFENRDDETACGCPRKKSDFEATGSVNHLAVCNCTYQSVTNVGRHSSIESGTESVQNYVLAIHSHSNDYLELRDGVGGL